MPLTDYWHDIRLAVRSLRKSPLVLTVAVLSLGIGIAASTTIFSMANAFLLRPPATDLADDVAAVFTSEGDGDLHGDNSYPDYLDVVENVEAVDKAFLHRVGGVDLDDGGPPRRLMVEIVAGDYFELMDLRLTLGRGFTPEETPMGAAERLVVLSHELWQERFDADPGVLGRSVRLDGHPYTVLGVGPEGYLSRFLGAQIEAWVPLGVPGGVYHARPRLLADRGDRQYWMMARLAPGRSLAQARAQLTLLAERLHAEHPEDWSDLRGEPRAFTVLPEEEALLPGKMQAALGGMFGMLLAGAGVILLIACSNVACIFLARANVRRREMAVRLALGAGRRRLLWMLLVESLVPALLAGVVGSFFASWACAAFDTIALPIGFPLRFDFHLDHRVLAFAFLLSVLTSVFFGLAPALEGARPDLVTSLKADAGTGDRRPGRLRLRRFLVVVQVAAALAFVAGAGLLLRGVREASTMDVDLDVERNAVMGRDLPDERYTPETAGQYLVETVERLRRLPEVEDAQLALSAELSILASIYEAAVEVEGHEASAEEPTFFSYNSVSPGYLAMLGLKLLAGRTFDSGDRPGAPLVAVVNESFVERFWPGEQGLGRTFRWKSDAGTERDDAGERPYQIVGVVRDGRYAGLDNVGRPYFWTALPQAWNRRVMIHVRGRTSAAEAVGALVREVELARDEPVALIRPMSYRELVNMQLMPWQALSRLAGWGGLFGMVLAILGIYGVMAFTVTLRTREMAIRQSLGARPGQVVRTVAGDGMKLALWGLGIGLCAAVPLAAMLRSELFGLSALDPIALGTSAAVLLGAAFVACFVPARRLAGLHPMSSLRDE